MGCVEKGDGGNITIFFHAGVSLHFPKLSAYSWRAAQADASHLGMINSYLLCPSTFMTHPSPAQPSLGVMKFLALQKSSGHRGQDWP